jgi:hypothetical protein
MQLIFLDDMCHTKIVGRDREKAMTHVQEFGHNQRITTTTYLGISYGMFST